MGRLQEIEITSENKTKPNKLGLQPTPPSLISCGWAWNR